MEQFKTHKGDIVTGDELINAINKVCHNCAVNAHAIRNEDNYADHVSEERKDELLEKSLVYYEEVRESALAGTLGYKVWFLQRLDAALTGETIGLLP